MRGIKPGKLNSIFGEVFAYFAFLCALRLVVAGIRSIV